MGNITISLVFSTVSFIFVCVVVDVSSWNDKDEKFDVSFNSTIPRGVEDKMDKIINYDTKEKFNSMERGIESIRNKDTDVGSTKLQRTSVKGTKHFVLINKNFEGKPKYGHSYYDNSNESLWSRCCSVYLTRWSLSGTVQKTEKRLTLNHHYESWQIFVMDIWSLITERFNFKGSWDWLLKVYEMIDLIMVKMSEPGDFENLIFSTKIRNVSIQQRKVVNSFMEHLETCQGANEMAAIKQTIPLKEHNSRNKDDKKKQLVYHTEHLGEVFKYRYKPFLSNRHNIDGYRRKKRENENKEDEDNKLNENWYKGEKPRSKRQVQTRSEKLKRIKGFEKIDEKEPINNVTGEIRLKKQKSNEKRKENETIETMNCGNLSQNTDTVFQIQLNTSTNKIGNLSKGNENLKSTSIEKVQMKQSENKFQMKPNGNKGQVGEVTETDYLRTDISGNLIKNKIGTQEQAKWTRITSEINGKVEKNQKVRKQGKFVMKENERTTREKMKDLEQNKVTKTNVKLDRHKRKEKRYKGANKLETSTGVERKERKSAEAKILASRKTNENKTVIEKYSRKHVKQWEELNTTKNNFSSNINKTQKRTETLEKEYRRRNLNESTTEHEEQSELSNGNVVVLQNENSVKKETEITGSFHKYLNEIKRENKLHPKSTKRKREVALKVTFKLIVCLLTTGNKGKNQMLKSENVNEPKAETNQNETNSSKFLSPVNSFAYENDLQQQDVTEKVKQRHYFGKEQKTTDLSEIESIAMNYFLNRNFKQNDTETSEYSYEMVNSEEQVKQEGTLKNKMFNKTMYSLAGINMTQYNPRNIEHKFEETVSNEKKLWMKDHKEFPQKIETTMEEQALFDEHVYNKKHKWEKKQGDLNGDFVALEISNDNVTQDQSKEGYDKYVLQKGSKDDNRVKKIKTTTEAYIMHSENKKYKKETESSEIKLQDSLLGGYGTKKNKETKMDEYVTLDLEKMWYGNEFEISELVKQVKDSLLNGIKEVRETNTDEYVITGSEEVGFENTTQNSELVREMQDSLSENETKEDKKTSADEHGIMGSVEVGYGNTTQSSEIVKKIQDLLLSENGIKEGKKRIADEYVITDSEEVGFENTTQESKIIKEIQNSLSENETKEYKETKMDEYVTLDLEKLWYENQTEISKIVKQVKDSLLNGIKEVRETNTDEYVITGSEEVGFENTTRNNEIIIEIQDPLLSENRTNENKKTSAAERRIMDSEEEGYGNTTQSSEIVKNIQDLLLGENGIKEDKQTSAYKYLITDSEEVSFENTAQESKIIKEIQNSLNENGTKEYKETKMDEYVTLDLEKLWYENQTEISKIVKQVKDSLLNGIKEVRETNTDEYVITGSEEVGFENTTRNSEIIKEIQDPLLSENRTNENKETSAVEHGIMDSEEEDYRNTTQSSEIIKQTEDSLLNENGTKENKETKTGEYVITVSVEKYEETTDVTEIIKVRDSLMTENEMQEYTEKNIDKYQLESKTNEYEEARENNKIKSANMLSSKKGMQEQTEANTDGYTSSIKEGYQENIDGSEITSKSENFFIEKGILEHTKPKYRYLVNGTKKEKYDVEDSKIIPANLASFSSENNNEKQMGKGYDHNVLNILKEEDSKETSKTTEIVTRIVDMLPNAKGMDEQEKANKYLMRNKDSREKATEDNEVISETVNLVLNESKSNVQSKTSKYQTQKNKKENNGIKEIGLQANNESFSLETEYFVMKGNTAGTEVEEVTFHNRETKESDKMRIKEQTKNVGYETDLKAVVNEKSPKEIKEVTLREIKVSVEEVENKVLVTQSTTEREGKAKKSKVKDQEIWIFTDSYNEEEKGVNQTTSKPESVYGNENYKILNGTVKTQLNEIERPSIKERGKNKKFENSINNDKNLKKNTSKKYALEDSQETDDKIVNKLVNGINVTRKQDKETGGNLELKIPKPTEEESTTYTNTQNIGKVSENESSSRNPPSNKALKKLNWNEKKYAREKTWKKEESEKIKTNKNRHCNRDERTFKKLLKVCMIKSYLFFVGSTSYFDSEEIITPDICRLNKEWCTDVVVSTVEKCVQVFFCDFFNCDVLYCPFALRIRVCPSLLKFGDKCTTDEECPYRQLCCYNGCYSSCREGVKIHPFYG